VWELHLRTPLPAAWLETVDDRAHAGAITLEMSHQVDVKQQAVSTS
jgi:hypothetical protein